MNQEREEQLDPVQEESKEFFGSVATTEYSRTVARLKYQERRAKLLFMRSLGRLERKRLRQKYAK